MPRVLLVKTSSLGDVVHNLPVVTDVSTALAGSRIDWVVEEAFDAILGPKNISYIEYKFSKLT